jgi:hypothetical protein
VAPIRTVIAEDSPLAPTGAEELLAVKEGVQVLGVPRTVPASWVLSSVTGRMPWSPTSGCLRLRPTKGSGRRPPSGARIRRGVYLHGHGHQERNG